MRCLGTWFSSGLGSVRLIVGLNDPKGLFQTKRFYNSVVLDPLKFIFPDSYLQVRNTFLGELKDYFKTQITWIQDLRFSKVLVAGTNFSGAWTVGWIAHARFYCSYIWVALLLGNNCCPHWALPLFPPPWWSSHPLPKGVYAGKSKHLTWRWKGGTMEHDKYSFGRE